MANRSPPGQYSQFGNSTTTGQTSDAPEVFVSPIERHPNSFPQHYDYGQTTAEDTTSPVLPKPEESIPATDPGEKTGKRWWRRPAVVIAAVIALLVIAGLVAGIAVVATKNNNGSGSSGSDGTRGSPWNNITLGCTDHSDKVDGTTYTTPRINGNGGTVPATSFTLHCDQNSNLAPNLFNIFATSFEGCLTSCAAWNVQNVTDTKCGAVTFAPAWTNESFAVSGGNDSPGDCFLKPKSKAKKGDDGLYAQDRNVLEVHAGYLKS